MTNDIPPAPPLPIRSDSDFARELAARFCTCSPHIGGERCAAHEPAVETRESDLFRALEEATERAAFSAADATATRAALERSTRELVAMQQERDRWAERVKVVEARNDAAVTLLRGGV